MNLRVEGKLSEHPFPRVLNYLYELGETGRLEVRRNRLSKILFLVVGAPAAVESTLRDETLGLYLVRQGKIKEEDYEASVETMVEQGLQQGAALVKMGCLKPKELYHAVKSQTKEKILSCFAWVDGDYRYESDTSFVEDIYRFEMSTPSILHEGIGRFFPPGAVETELARAGLAPLVWLEAFEEELKALELTREEQAFLKQIDGRKNIIELRKSGPDIVFINRLLYLLLLTGLIGPAKQKAESLRAIMEEVMARPPIQDFMFPPASEESAAELEEEEEEYVIEGLEPLKTEEDVLTTYMTVKDSDYFSLLGIKRDAADQEVEQAYRAKSREHEAAKYISGMSQEAESKREEICARIIRAYETLKTDTGRKEYIESLAQEAPSKEEHPLRPEELVQKGIKFVRTRDYSNAQRMFEEAVRLKPDEPSYLAYLGWTIYCNTEIGEDQRHEQAKKHLVEAIQLNPHMDSARVFLGKILKDELEIEAALEQFREALISNPRCKEAERELAAHKDGEW